MFTAKQMIYDASKRLLPSQTRDGLKLRLVEMRRRLMPWGRPLPDFLIIGAMRGGTSSLYKYLDSHPGTAASIRKEVAYFLRDDQEDDPPESWYRAHFPMTRHRLAFEATPAYLPSTKAPRQAAETIPNAKMVAIVRDPVQRAKSHHRLRVTRRTESRPFLQAIDAEMSHHTSPVLSHGTPKQTDYLMWSLYGQQLERWLNWFPAEQVGVFFSEDLYEDTARTLSQIATFLGIPPTGFKDIDRNYSRRSGEATPSTSSSPYLHDLPSQAQALLLEDRERLRTILFDQVRLEVTPDWVMLR